MGGGVFFVDGRENYCIRTAEKKRVVLIDSRFCLFLDSTLLLEGGINMLPAGRDGKLGCFFFLAGRDGNSQLELFSCLDGKELFPWRDGA